MAGGVPTVQDDPAGSYSARLSHHWNTNGQIPGERGSSCKCVHVWIIYKHQPRNRAYNENDYYTGRKREREREREREYMFFCCRRRTMAAYLWH